MNIDNPKYNIGDVVFHATPDGEQGIVIDCTYSLIDKRWMYYVSFGVKDNTTSYYEIELISQKIF